jgi:hypothetical protein
MRFALEVVTTAVGGCVCLPVFRFSLAALKPYQAVSATSSAMPSQKNVSFFITISYIDAGGLHWFKLESMNQLSAAAPDIIERAPIDPGFLSKKPSRTMDIVRCMS